MEESEPIANGTSNDVPSIRQQLTDTSSRFPYWLALTVMSSVCFFSMVLQRHLWTGPWGWAVAVSIMSMICAFFGYIGYIKARGIFMGQLPELYLAGFVLFLWITGLPVIMDPNNNIAIGITEIVDANIYFSSWAAFIISMMLCGSIAREIYGVDVWGRASPIVKTRMGKWYILVFSSTIMLICSVQAYLAEECMEDVMKLAPKCKQTNFGISAGVIGTVFGAGIVGYTLKKEPLKLLWEWNAALAMVVLYAFALAYVTTALGPGSSVGNLYFATWASFILSILIFGDCHVESLMNQEQVAMQSASTDEIDNDLELQDQNI